MEGTVFTYIFSRYLHMKGEGGTLLPSFWDTISPPYNPNQQDKYGGGLQNNLERMYRNLEGAIYTSPVQKLITVLYRLN